MAPLLIPLGTIGSIPMGASEWIAASLGSGYGSAVTSLSGSTYIQTYSSTVKLNEVGKFVWGYTFSGSSNKQGMAIDANENVYISGGASLVASFTKDGALRWQREVGTGISWDSIDVDSTGTYVYVAGSNSTYGHIAKLDATTGTAVWKRAATTRVEFVGVSVSPDGQSISATGYISNGTTLDSHFVKITSAGSVSFQKRLSYGTSNYAFSQSTAFATTTSNVAVSGFQNSPRRNFVVGFTSAGNTSFSIKAGASGYMSNDYGTIGFDPSGKLYLGFNGIYNNYGPLDWGSGYTRFTGSTPEKTVTFRSSSGSLGVLRLSSSEIDSTIGLMGTGGIVKVDGQNPPPAGTYGNYTVYHDPDDYFFESSGLSIYSDSVSYIDLGTATTVSSYSVVPFTSSTTVTYIK